MRQKRDISQRAAPSQLTERELPELGSERIAAFTTGTAGQTKSAGRTHGRQQARLHAALEPCVERLRVRLSTDREQYGARKPVLERNRPQPAPLPDPETR